MRLTDNVRLTSGIIVATPSMRKHVIAKRVMHRWSIDRERRTLNKQTTRTEMTSAPSVRRLYFSSPYFQRDMDSKNRRDCTSSTRSRKPSWSNLNAVALLKADGTVVGHVPSSFLLGSLGQQSLLTLLGPQQWQRSVSCSDRHFSHMLWSKHSI